MTEREYIFEEIDGELKNAAARWGTDFDDNNTSNDWVAYVAKYAGQAVTLPFSRAVFEENMKKIAGIAVSAIEASRRNGGPAPRHYDSDYRQEDTGE